MFQIQLVPHYMKCDDATAAEAVISTLDGMELEGWGCTR
jgi:hypothetical protein